MPELMFILNIIVTVLATVGVFMTTKGEGAVYDLRHLLRRVTNELNSFANRTDTKEQQITAFMWVAGLVIVACMFMNFVGILVALLLGGLIGNWVCKEPVAPTPAA